MEKLFFKTKDYAFFVSELAFFESIEKFFESEENFTNSSNDDLITAYLDGLRQKALCFNLVSLIPEKDDDVCYEHVKALKNEFIMQFKEGGIVNYIESSMLSKVIGIEYLPEFLKISHSLKLDYLQSHRDEIKTSAKLESALFGYETIIEATKKDFFDENLNSLLTASLLYENMFFIELSTGSEDSEQLFALENQLLSLAHYLRNCF